MPTTAIYVILSTVIGPALIKMGVTPMAAHLFIFYFGVMSFLTPPVAVSSFVAAGLAEASMWRTGWVGMRLAAVSMLLPFVWAYDPALLLDGSWLSIAIVIATTMAAILVISRGFIMLQDLERDKLAGGLALVIGALAIGASPIWLGPESLIAGAIAVAALIALKTQSVRQGRAAEAGS
jgi:TRAP-type uncharacterized transport system fused permease subunit